MSGAYAPIPVEPGHIPRRPSLTSSRRRNRLLLILFPVTLVIAVVLYASSSSHLGSWMPSGSPTTDGFHTLYRPGRLGKSLLARHRATLGSSSTEDWESLLASTDELADEMFDLMAGRDEEACRGWTGGGSSKKSCWRSDMVDQIKGWDRKDADIWPSLKSLNNAALDRLTKCLLVYPSELPVYPNYTETNPRMPINLTDTDDMVGEDTRPCSLTSTKVLLGNWWYFTMAYGDFSQSPGESVWLRNQIRALYELGYTIIATNTYEGMVSAHRAMPDVITQIWTEDRHTLTCQDDPYCVEFSSFKPTNEKYPGTAIDEATHLPDFWNDIYSDPKGPPQQRWAWLNHELSRIPEEERGTIPAYKLFTATYWGSRPEDPDWDFTKENFPWNALGQQWTLTPFAYPLHTYIPYSIEHTCAMAPHVSPLEKSDQLFVLAKQTTYFQDPWASIPSSFWAQAKNLTGLDVASVATGDDELPKGILSSGHVSRAEFEVMVSKSKLMLGIGRPLISPSVYSALCQGTPVVLPYFQEKAINTGWDLFNGALAQHGPAAAIGPPYVYSYKTGDVDDLVDKIKQAAANPIERYIPPDMTYEAELKNMDDLMRFDWKRMGGLVQETGTQHDTPLRRHVVARCFKIGRCTPIRGEL